MELKELAPYLPYGLKVQLTLSESTELPWYMAEDGIYTLEGMMLDWMGNGVEEIKPRMRHLTDLAKEIEHNGERFIPYYKIADYWHEKLDNCMNMIRPQTGALPLDLNLMLFEWHFDVFGLIEKNEAIKIE